MRVMLSRVISAYYDPIGQSREHATTSRQSRLYAAPSLCGSASATRGTFPTSAVGLCVRAAGSTPMGPLRRPVNCGAAMPGFLDSLTSRHPQQPVSASNARRGTQFRRCNVRFMLRPVRLPSPPDWLRPDGVTCAPPGLLRYRIAPACNATRYRGALGVRLDGRTGNLPSSGLPPD
jgi:hypothetical protein